jgi:hypothetical protein
MTADPLNKREAVALFDAAKRPGGWGLFFPKTTAKLAERGFFIKEKHPVYGMQWRITASGHAALQAAE